MYRIKIITSDATLPHWPSLPKKLELIHEELRHIRNATFQIDIEHRNLTPEVRRGRITHEWMDALSWPLYREGWHFVCFHMSEDQKRGFGIYPETLRGVYHVDYDLVSEFYLWADEHTKRHGLDQFVQTFLHELRHALMRGMGLPDDTHEMHADGEIRGSFGDLDMANFSPRRRNLLKQIELLRRLIAVLTPATTLHKRLKEPLNQYISQSYGVKSAKYPATGRHIGVDYAVPEGTPVFAPWDGEMIAVGTTPSLGHYGYFRYTWLGRVRVERLIHLLSVPRLGHYRRGDTIARSGNTGASTGPHLHVDGWWDDVNISIINSENWQELTYNPHI